jgi:nitrogen regulatory protein P-II 1
MLFMAFGFLAAQARQEYYLRMVTCVIRPEQLNELTAELDRGDLMVGMTVSDVRGFGRQNGQVDPAELSLECDFQYHPKLKLEILVRRKDVDHLVETIVKSVRTGRIGDGKIVVYDAACVMRVRTGEKGRDAL